jgi:malate/lactate dehydrogenase
MATASIIGAGELGGSVAHALAASATITRIVLVDDAGDVASGKALDIQQSLAITGSAARLDGTRDAGRVAGSTVCILASGARLPSSDGDGLRVLTRVTPHLTDVPLVFAGADHAPWLLTAFRDLKIQRKRLIGSASEALAAAARSLVALEAHCSPSDVALGVLGAPQGGFLVPWSDASIGGYSVERVLTQVQLNRLDASVARLWPPGPYALGLAAARVAEAMVTPSRRRFNLLTVLEGEFGVKERVGVLPTIVSRLGIAHTRVPVLTTRDRVRVENVLG